MRFRHIKFYVKYEIVYKRVLCKVYISGWCLRNACLKYDMHGIKGFDEQENITVFINTWLSVNKAYE